ncbi:MAG: PAS domain-containing protein [Rhodospirillales bacterium]|nr:PAS domain-containing protein [Rhodospirillales bacterium]
MINKGVFKLRKPPRRPDIDPDLILNVMASVVVCVDADVRIIYVNNAGEQFFQNSAGNLRGQRLDQLIPADSPLFSLISQCAAGSSVVEYQVTLASPRIGHHVVNVQASALPELDAVVVSMQERSLAAKIDRQLTHRGAARSVGAMAAMLAHEVKNPLAGIRGAAQLLEQSVRQEDLSLTRLIRDETDRVCSLVDRMEVFSTGAPLQREAVNIHEVLVRVRTLAENSFGQHLRFVEGFDPSLPAVHGNHDQLVQVFLNLIKNAAEAAPYDGGEVTITTAYWHGVRFAVAGAYARMHLPLMVSIQDNGEGIEEDLKPHLFEPFVTSKPKGSGLGLAMVAKIIGDHGGVIEFESEPKRTVFRVMLPMYSPAEDAS